jgi:hypothetical protein
MPQLVNGTSPIYKTNVIDHKVGGVHPVVL